jgi:hypothetical protein
MTGKDVISFSMRDIMNGHLNVNYTQVNNFLGAGTGDPCGVNLSVSPAVYLPKVGFGSKQFIRFSHPEAGNTNSDAFTSVSVYAPDAFAAFRNRVWDSLDESGDITSFTSSSGANILDSDNPVCFGPANGDSVFATDLSGYLTIDVVNYCTNYFPDTNLAPFFDYDAIATSGWGPTASPNALIGDIFYVDSASTGGNISGDQAIAIEFDPILVMGNLNIKTFYGKFVLNSACVAEVSGGGCNTGISANVPVAYRFPGDGRETLGDHYGFRYLNDSANGLQSWVLVWRSDMYRDTNSDGSPASTPTINLCDWLEFGGPKGSGLFDSDHQLNAAVYDNDENSFVTGGPSGSTTLGQLFVFLESQRINLLNNGQINPSGFKGGWVDALFVNPGAGFTYNGMTGRNWNQAWVGVQHTAPGAFLSVGHSAAELSNSFNCVDFPVVGGVTSGLTK